jgi:hypothetical protein
VEYFWQGTNKIGEATAAPYAVTWNNTPSGSNAVVAVATDVLDKTSTSAPVFLVLNAAPSVAITSPQTTQRPNPPPAPTTRSVPATTQPTPTPTTTNGAVAGIDLTTDTTLETESSETSTGLEAVRRERAGPDQ